MHSPTNSLIHNPHTHSKTHQNDLSNSENFSTKSLIKLIEQQQSIIGQLQKWKTLLDEDSEPLTMPKNPQEETSVAHAPSTEASVPDGAQQSKQDRQLVPPTRGVLKRTIGTKRRGQIPPFLAHPILAIALFKYGSDPYTLISSRRAYSEGVQHEFGDIMDQFKVM
jgi:hypothetical protein